MVAKKVINNFCPLTSQLLALIGWGVMVAELVFIVLCFIFGAHWWYGLIAVAIYFFVPMLLPKTNPFAMSEKARAMSTIGTVVCDLLLVGMYLSLFHVI